MSWLDFALDPLPDLFTAPPGGVSVKVKDAMLKRRLTDPQIDVVHDYMTRTDHDVMGGMLGLATYGGHINTVARDATASAQRSSIERIPPRVVRASGTSVARRWFHGALGSLTRYAAHGTTFGAGPSTFTSSRDALPVE